MTDVRPPEPLGLKPSFGFGDRLGRTLKLADGPTIGFHQLVVRRAAVKYGRAISHAIKLAAHVDRVMAKRGSPYEIELSLDESPQPTTPAEHYIIAEQCLLSSF